MITTPFILSAVGLGLSIYGLHLERKIAQNPEYKPACDISDQMSCSQAVKSKYANPFGMSTSLLGIAFYSTVLACSILRLHSFILLLATGSLCASGFLAYTLYFKVKTICPLCTAVYLLNIALFITSYYGI